MAYWGFLGQEEQSLEKQSGHTIETGKPSGIANHFPHYRTDRAAIPSHTLPQLACEESLHICHVLTFRKESLCQLGTGDYPEIMRATKPGAS